MKKLISKLYIAWLIITVGLFSACTPDSFELEGKDVTVDDLVEGIAFSIIIASAGPIHFKSVIFSSFFLSFCQNRFII